MSGPSRVTAVIVAYNRRDLLTEVLDALAHQTRAVDSIVVVNNASTDDTSQVVRDSGQDVTLIELTRNTGGAGGFAVGMAAAMVRHNPDWIWVMDDDTVPDKNALLGLMNTVTGYPGTALTAVGSRVVWTDGDEHPMNTPRENPFASAREKSDADAVSAMPVRSLSFVSSMYRADRVRAVGYPIVDYFLWNDDFEFSTRVLHGHRGLSTPASVVVHKTARRGSTDDDPGERFRFEVRNKIWLFRHSRALRRREKFVYGASSLVRWGRTVVKSGDRRVLRDGFVHGRREALQRPPRPNAEALYDAGVPGDVIAELGRAE
ncbi:glycosyltransferase [Paramicrobacterium chengjingii]|uniref:Glycosyltransferase n=1 Tax=Paramicrobacterium chengjingii TaxID=2769067 RepID=A0ABX6YKP6_9MICO|nr:glycosyltransferase [Microbacterium chengjingii]QPZ39386.1 glycosyltransferase [Microbacterium chengjingii]